MNEIPPPELPRESPDSSISSLIPDHELIRRIGHGSYGEVWLARNIMGTYRAVKIVHRGSFEDERPFEREYSGIRSFEPISRSHESQVDILHVGRQEELFYYVMELADDQQTGQEIDPGSYVPNTLNTLVQRREKLTAEETLEIALALTTALEHLHSHGLIHRDIKPSNIIFVHGIPKLADIGLVSKIDDCRSFVGTEGFLPPEGPGTARADIYSLGKVLYEACTGRDRKDYPELPTMLAELPDRERLLELNAIIAKACREDASERYASADEMHQDFLLMQSGKSVLRMRALERRLEQLRTVGLVGLVVFLVALGAYFFQRHQTAEATRLAEENKNLADENVEQLRRLKVAKGVELMDQGDLGSSLLWFADALQLVKDDPVAEATHRFRFEQVWSRLPRLSRMFSHDDIVYSSRFSPDGKRLVTASGDKTARVWDVETGEPITPPLVHEGEVTMADFSHGGDLVMTTGGDFVARLWDARTGTQLPISLEHQDVIPLARFHPADDRVITFSLDGKACVWDIATGALLRELVHDEEILAGALSHEGKFIATGDATGKVRVWRTDTGELLSTSDHLSAISSMHFDPSGSLLFVTTQSSIGGARVIDPQIGRFLTRMDGHTDSIKSSSISPDGKLVATGSNDNTARVWDMQSGRLVAGPIIHGNEVNHVGFSPDGRWVVSSSGDSTAKIWDARTGELVMPHLTHGAWVMFAAFSPDGTLLATASDSDQARIWNLSSTSDPSYRLGEGVVNKALSGDSNITLLKRNKVAEVWSLDDAQMLLSVDVPDETVAAWSRAEHVFLIDYQKDQHSVRVIDTAFEGDAPRASRYLIDHGTSKTLIMPLGHIIATIHDNGCAVKAIDILSNKVVIDDIHFASKISKIDSDEKLEIFGIGMSDRSVHVFDVSSGKKLYSVQHEGEIREVEFSPCKQWLLTTSSDQTCRIWDANTGKPRTPPFRQGGRVDGGKWAPDSSMVACYGSNERLKVWDPRTGLQVHNGMLHEGAVLSAAFSPDVRFLASACRGHTARIWDAATGEALIPALRFSRMPSGVIFSPDGTKLYGITTGGVRCWPLGDPEVSVKSEDMPAFARLLISRSVDAAGNFYLVPSDEMANLHDNLRSNYPRYFQLLHSEKITWHRRQFEQSLVRISPFAATFHLTQLKLKGVSLDYDALFRQIEDIGIPDRPSGAKPSSIDLTEFYNFPIEAGWDEVVGDRGFTNLKPGIKRIEGLEFDLRGMVYLRGTQAGEPEILSIPDRVDRIPVGQKADKLNFLHALIHAYAPKGWEVGHYVVRYVDGIEVEFPLRKGIELDDWVAITQSSTEESTPQLGWKGESGMGRPVGVFLSAWENPLPDREVESIDFVSANEQARLFLLAITAESEDGSTTSDEAE